MKTLITRVAERGQISIPASVRRSLGVRPGERLIWEASGDHECRVRRVEDAPIKGAMAMRGFAGQFRETRPTDAWMRELREGEAD
jgi:AbrB family looped-hinge helix DNA binding protein